MPFPISRRCALAATLVLACPALAAEPDTWLSGGRPSPLADQALALLGQAASHGLDAHDYDVQRLGAALAAAHEQPLSGTGSAALAQALEHALLRYLSHLHHGRVDPRQIHHDFDIARRPPFDADALLRQAVAAGRLSDAVAAAVPPLPQYDRLRAALARLRALGAHAAWGSPLRPLPAGRPSWLQRLRALGDLVDEPTPDTPLAVPADVPADVPDEVLAAAVKRFQARHGLEPDGVAGPATRGQLAVPPAARVRQVELALERLRWTPLMQGPRMIVVNIPEFRLRAYEVVDGRILVRQDMRVVVGRALRHRTPLFDQDMRSIEFSPYWNVPPSIARDELVPRLRHDPAHLAREDFEFVGPGGTVDRTVTAERLRSVLAGAWRIRQRPGEHNALGGIKFVFPNRDAIYLHHTPATRLFTQARRDFSHGCIRVEDPVALAGFVLQGMPGWDPSRIRTAMASSHAWTLRLEQPVPVLIAYGTALVKDGRTHFFDDIYGHDRTLDAALRRASGRAGP
jgi:murein L,D-transpeptidase YcbB/YkuD